MRRLKLRELFVARQRANESQAAERSTLPLTTIHKSIRAISAVEADIDITKAGLDDDLVSPVSKAGVAKPPTLVTRPLKCSHKSPRALSRRGHGYSPQRPPPVCD